MRVIDPLAGQIAYHVSRCRLFEKGRFVLRVHVRDGFDVTPLTVALPLSVVET